MMLSVLVLTLLAVGSTAAAATILDYAVYVGPHATTTDMYAANEIASLCASAGGSLKPLQVFNGPTMPTSQPMIVVGSGALTTAYPSLASFIANLGLEGFFVSQVVGGKTNNYVISGSPSTERGTLYGTYHFLREAVGFRWWSPYVNSTPNLAPPAVFNPTINATEVPVIEYRDVYYWQFETGDGIEAATRFSLIQRNNALQFDSEGMILPGGGVRYADPPGAAHTAFLLIPPSVYQATHPEWFGGSDQLCWTNSSLIVELISVVSNILRSQPTANIISVSQNDNFNYCKTAAEMAVINEEGSPSGPILRAVNAIADAVSVEFPNVAVHTFAYQYSRPPPKLTKPRPNVVVQLCSIECDFGVPLSDPNSTLNAAFRHDLITWSSISQRLYIWDYVTDFANFVMPWPDYYTIAPNIRFYVQNGAKGIFEEGAYTSSGSDMQELKSYFIFFLMERITTRILKTIEDENPYRLLDPDGQMSDEVT